LQNALAGLKSSANQYHEAAKNSPSHDGSVINQLNAKLIQTERWLLAPQGIPLRGWYNHAIYAPGYYTGYGVKTLPGLREAIENRNWKLAQEQEVIIAKVLAGYAANLDTATAILKAK
jgi:N-acetylated-alpha-linked acidic dipeptidase